jgi:hypothetical protein
MAAGAPNLYIGQDGWDRNWHQIALTMQSWQYRYVRMVLIYLYFAWRDQFRGLGAQARAVWTYSYSQFSMFYGMFRESGLHLSWGEAINSSINVFMYDTYKHFRPLHYK